MSFSRLTALFAAVSAAFTLVNAHGSLSFISSGGQSFTGPVPGSGTGSNSPIREISTLEPIANPADAAMACGPGAASSANVVLDVAAGGSVTFGWRSGVDTIAWPHRWGPVMLYAYQCPSGVNATNCQPPSDAQWVLISAAGFDSQSQAGIGPDPTGWVQDRFHFNQTVAAQIPKGLPSGQYLLRHEIIALHKGNQNLGAEYYVSCTQARVTGGASGTTASIGAERVALPGAYSPTDPGILVNVFDSSLNGSNYKMPGPAVFGGSASGGAVNNAPSPTDQPTGTAAPTPTSSGSCQAKKKRALLKRHQVRAAAAAQGVELRGKPKRLADPEY